MLKTSALIAVVFILTGLPQNGAAQIVNLALGQAKSRLACGAGVVVSSVFLPNGSLQVTCARNPGKSSSTTSSATTTATTPASVVAQTTGLVTPAGLSVIGAVVITGVIAGGGDTSGSSTASGTGSVSLSR